jgi:hypothetical protein
MRLGIGAGVALLLALPADAQAPAAPAIRLVGDARPGGLLIVQAPTGTTRLLADGSEVPAAPDGRYLVGLDGDAHSELSLDPQLRL